VIKREAVKGYFLHLYIPLDFPDDTVGRLAWYKRAMGMNLDQLGEIMDRDPEQLSDWLSGRHYPFRKNREKIERFLEKQQTFLLTEKKYRFISSVERNIGNNQLNRA